VNVTDAADAPEGVEHQETATGLAAAAGAAAGEEAEEVVEEEEPEPPLCPDVQTWVEHVYAPTYIRKITQTQRWCPSWWAHPEAIVRLTALWRTWEAARASEDDTAMADWVRAYLDAINPVLLAADAGPFASCAPDRHSEQAPMPLTAPPADYWTED